MNIVTSKHSSYHEIHPYVGLPVQALSKSSDRPATTKVETKRTEDVCTRSWTVDFSTRSSAVRVNSGSQLHKKGSDGHRAGQDLQTTQAEMVHVTYNDEENRSEVKQVTQMKATAELR